ncbi:hypothetical protein HG531_001802 [Fusarium graminearum]|nr:hypothetical protein HG531_001802 [Fusarium graminearum]
MILLLFRVIVEGALLTFAQRLWGESKCRRQILFVQGFLGLLPLSRLLLVRLWGLSGDSFSVGASCSLLTLARLPSRLMVEQLLCQVREVLSIVEEELFSSCDIAHSCKLDSVLPIDVENTRRDVAAAFVTLRGVVDVTTQVAVRGSVHPDAFIFQKGENVGNVGFFIEYITTPGFSSYTLIMSNQLSDILDDKVILSDRLNREKSIPNTFELTLT